MAVIHSLSPGFKNQVSGVGCQVSGERNVRAENQNLNTDTWYLENLSKITNSLDLHSHRYWHKIPNPNTQIPSNIQIRKSNDQNIHSSIVIRQ
jgi:hypothetical protein